MIRLRELNIEYCECAFEIGYGILTKTTNFKVISPLIKEELVISVQRNSSITIIVQPSKSIIIRV